MEELIVDLFGSYAGLVLAVMGVCSAVAALLPAPTGDSNVAYKVVYKVLNWLAMNVGRARNADEAQAGKGA